MSIRQQLSKITLIKALAGLITLGTIGSAAAVESFYSITDLGTLPGSSTTIATGINDSGQVVGYLANDGPSRAFFWENGVMTDLGTLGGSRSFVGGINNSGQVVGGSETGEVTYDGSPIYHSFRWSQSVGMTDLTPMRDSLISTRAEGINDAGQVIGSTENNNAFLWENGAITDLCQLRQSCSVYDINNSSQIVGSLEVVVDTECLYGESCHDITVQRAHIWENGRITDLGTLGDPQTSSYAFAINDLSQIVGEANLHAVLWKNRTITDLGTLGGKDSIALDINNLGQVVGRSATTSVNHAFLWDNTNGMQDLNSLISANSGWLLSEARAINEAGQIVGSGIINGQQHAFLLTPDSERQPVR